VAGGNVCEVQAHPDIITERRETVDQGEYIAGKETGILNLGRGCAPVVPSLVSWLWLKSR
jgi:hypothetical protein